jgi:RNA 2',3'-cyclic 3'-phosphodiesterase
LFHHSFGSPQEAVMIRLFVGIDPPEWIKDILGAAQGGVSAARWQTREQLHLTLRFIGEVDRRTAQDVADNLSVVHHPAFSLALSGQTGVFGKANRPDTLWVGVSPEAPVKALHNKVDQALRGAGLQPEQRQFKPHITLARLNNRTGPLEGFMVQAGGLASAAFLVESFCLYQSTLTQDGAIYDILECYPLARMASAAP